MMLFSNLIPTHDHQKGYQATHSNWVHCNNSSGLLLDGGPVPISDEGNEAVVAQLWNTVRTGMVSASNMMKLLFLFLGVTNEEISPFYQEFTSLSGLSDEFIAYCPSTFSYHGVLGIGKEDNAIELNQDDSVMFNTIATKMCSFVNELLGGPNSTGDSAISGATSNDKSITDNEDAAATNGTKANQGAAKNAKIVFA
eukprot:15365166-Ditylum_brightwellii.AAC.1